VKSPRKRHGLAQSPLGRPGERASEAASWWRNQHAVAGSRSRSRANTCRDRASTRRWKAPRRGPQPKSLTRPGSTAPRDESPFTAARPSMASERGHAHLVRGRERRGARDSAEAAPIRLPQERPSPSPEPTRLARTSDSPCRADPSKLAERRQTLSDPSSLGQSPESGLAQTSQSGVTRFSKCTIEVNRLQKSATTHLPGQHASSVDVAQAPSELTRAPG